MAEFCNNSARISVCAMRDTGEGGWSLSGFSSRGPTLDGRIKPDICAPGSRISAPKANSGDQYVVMSGTSMASPFVAGTVALMLEANPYLTVDQVRETLFETAQDWGAAGKDADFGYGRINAYRAVQRVMGLPGAGPANPLHAVARGQVQEGEESWFRLNVTDTSKPLAATLLLTGRRQYDLDLFLYDEEGNELAASAEMERQESIHFRPEQPGRYFLNME